MCREPGVHLRFIFIRPAFRHAGAQIRGVCPVVRRLAAPSEAAGLPCGLDFLIRLSVAPSQSGSPETMMKLRDVAAI
ncbi:MAG: hypothetical protein U1E69_06495 [Tabrizicola sp.]|uniref:hypothetical protein n=1 Tax=Tabrizicola sp. TaxID=2005166 RepID=UPI002AB8108A|nr:hypothetical protein [Tabrizicola sp.]MDZ4086439.1 hypothetical protein [Tabrizicola sp.]